MGYDNAASKRSVSVTLNDDLLRQVECYTGDLSKTLETLLADFVEHQESHRRDEAVAETILFFNEFHAEHGLLSDEFQDL